MPERIQLRRQRGWRIPPGAVIVDRRTEFGNPFPVDGDWITWTAVSLGYRGDAAGRRAASIALYRAWITDAPVEPGPLAKPADRDATVDYADGSSAALGRVAMGFAEFASQLVDQPPTWTRLKPTLEHIRSTLGGRALACWCRPDALCHGSVLLSLANPPDVQVLDEDDGAAL